MKKKIQLWLRAQWCEDTVSCLFLACTFSCKRHTAAMCVNSDMSSLILMSLMIITVRQTFGKPHRCDQFQAPHRCCHSFPTDKKKKEEM